MPVVVLSSDRTMMSNYHGREFLGFGATSPSVGVPEFIFRWIFTPRMQEKNGVVREAPYGLRKIEAKLLDEGIDAVTVDPSHLKKYLKEAKVLLISGHDYFGLGPPSTTFSSLLKRESLNAISFRKFITGKDIKKAKEGGLKIIAGGPGAWQFRIRDEQRKKYGIDCVVEGEGENIILDLVLRVINGEDLPEFVNGDEHHPSVGQIPEIKNPSINGLVEIGRGCPRGCSFCSVTRKPLRWYPLEKIEREIKVNTNSGITGGIIHADDVFLYGSKDFKPNPEKLFPLLELSMSHYRTIAFSHVSLSSVICLKNKFEDIAETVLQNQKFFGAEVGIETGSVRLAREIMKNKAKPFDVERWKEIVYEAFGIMHDHSMIPAGTLIIGIPGETPDDVYETIELVEELRDFRSLIVPLFFVPLGLLKNEKWFLARNVREDHIELLKACLRHDMKWIRKILPGYFEGVWYGPLLQLAFRMFFRGVGRLFRKYGIQIN